MDKADSPQSPLCRHTLCESYKIQNKVTLMLLAVVRHPTVEYQITRAMNYEVY